MQDDDRKAECYSLKVSIVIWVFLTGYLSFHTWGWDPPKPFLTTELLVIWVPFALLSGALVAVSEWDLVFNPRNLQLCQALRFLLGFLAYILFFLAFNTGVLLVLLYTLDGAMSRLYPDACTDPVMIIPSIGPGGNRYLFLACFIALTIVQIFSVSKLLAKWFSTTMENWLNLPNPPAREARYFRTTVRPGGKVEIASPELEAGQMVDVAVNPVKYHTGQEG